MEEEELFERPERAGHRILDRIRPGAERVRRNVRKVPRPTRGAVGVVVLAVLLADLAVVGSRRGATVAVVPRGGQLAEASQDPASLEVGTLDGKGPFAIFAVEKGTSEHVRIFAVDLGVAPVTGTFPKVYLGEYPGFVADYAGAQGQAAGSVVPINTAQETTDASRATRLWLLQRGKTVRSVLSTFDFVSAYALNSAGDAIAVSRRSVTSPARGAFLWLYPIEPTSARQVGSLRRPGGSGPASALRPVGWGPDDRTIFATPFCDQCGDDGERGLFVVSLADGLLRRFSPTRERPVFAPSFSADGKRFVFQETVRLPTCELFELCEGRRLIAVDVPTGRVREIATSNELSFESPVISPDGRLVAYASGRGNEIVWRSFDTGRAIGAVDVSPSEEVHPVAWMSARELLVVGRTSSARPDGSGEGNLFRVTRQILNDGTDQGAHIELVASDDTLTFLGWLK